MRVLIVEDEPDLRSSLARALRDEEYAVDVAEDGEEAIERALAHDYDAIILDVMLPGKNGWEVLEQVRRAKPTPVLMLTARDNLKDRLRGLDSGADDYLIKPFYLAELMARLRVLVRRNAGQADPKINASGRIIDTAARKITWQSEEVPLTAFEYNLVEYLALRRGQVITRTELYEHLYDENSITLSNLINVHVSNIRKKLGAEFIETRRGHGYCIP